MNKIIDGNELYIQTDMSPKEVEIGYSRERSLVNSISIVTGAKWNDIVKKYIDQCHFRSNMASNKTCMSDTLRVNGFIPYHFKGNIQHLLELCNSSIPNHQKFIIKVSFGYLSIVPNDNSSHYVVKGSRTFKTSVINQYIEEVWLYVPGTDNRTGIKRANQGKHKTNETSTLMVKNMNPDGKNVGDCVIRGLSAVYGCTWHEAMNLIAEATNYTDPILNITPNIHTTLIKLGFERHRTMHHIGNNTSGKNLCQYFDRTYSNGERIFAFVGNHHCAAILPTKLNDGSVKYKIQDTWDSTERKIEEYWVYFPNGNITKNTPKPSLIDLKPQFQINGSIFHPQFGEGVVVDVSGYDTNRILMIQFEKVGVKRIAESWLRTH